MYKETKTFRITNNLVLWTYFGLTGRMFYITFSTPSKIDLEYDSIVTLRRCISLSIVLIFN